MKLKPSFLLYFKRSNAIGKRKGPYGPVGIKNSWKYEKDLIILNEIINFFAINHMCYLL